MTSLTECIGKAFYQLHGHIERNKYSSYWLKGGRGSLKSSFAAIEIILGIVNDEQANALVVRKVKDTVRKSVFETLLWAIDRLDLNEAFRHTYSPAEIIYIPTGQKIMMVGLDDPKKLKSIKVKRGYIKLLWFEELEEFSSMDEIRNVRQSVRRGGDTFVEFLSYNPPRDPAAWVNEECLIEEDGKIVHESNYLDAPREWLGEQFLIDAENLKRRDPLKYEHEYMGQSVGRAKQIVFHGKWEEREFETHALPDIYQSRFFYGADWGFSVDPTALIRCYIVHENGETNLYIDHEGGGHGIEIDELPDEFDLMPDIKRWRIYGDSARPETISYVANRGYDVQSAPKWKGSVEDGVEYIKSFDRVIIHPRCVRTIDEFKKYSYKVDRHTLEILPVLQDKHNHWIDALRYALADYIQAEVSILDVI